MATGEAPGSAWKTSSVATSPGAWGISYTTTTRRVRVPRCPGLLLTYAIHPSSRDFATAA